MIPAGSKLASGLFFFLALAVLPTRVHAQQQPTSGVVTAVEGQPQLTRPNVPKPATLRQKDNVFIRDIIDTREKSTRRFQVGLWAVFFPSACGPTHPCPRAAAAHLGRRDRRRGSTSAYSPEVGC